MFAFISFVLALVCDVLDFGLVWFLDLVLVRVSVKYLDPSEGCDGIWSVFGERASDRCSVYELGMLAVLLIASGA